MPGDGGLAWPVERLDDGVAAREEQHFVVRVVPTDDERRGIARAMDGDDLAAAIRLTLVVAAHSNLVPYTCMHVMSLLRRWLASVTRSRGRHHGRLAAQAPFGAF
jgi:hypothetical protein